MPHTENCQKCKAAFGRALRKEFGDIIEQWQSGWPCKIENIISHPKVNGSTAKSLKEIFNTLQNYRGHENFVRKSKLLPSDYYIKSLNCLVEFDESQHFTIPRKVALSLYPKTIKLAFDRKEWINKCSALSRKDNDPQFRDEQRAWYDTLRDLLPSSFGLNPTIRIFAKERIWCKDQKSARRFLLDKINVYLPQNKKRKKKAMKRANLEKVTAAHVKEAIAKIKIEGVPNRRAAKSTKLFLNKKLYPAKYVLGEAYRLATQVSLSPDDFHGGNAAAKILFNLGFSIIKNGKPWEPIESNCGKKLFRIFLKGTYKNKNGEHNGPGFTKWVIKNGNMTKNRMVSIFNELEKVKGSLKNSVILFPACTLVIKTNQDFQNWKTFLQKKSKNKILILGILDLTRAKNNNEFTAVYSKGSYFEIDPAKPQRQLPCGAGYAYISSNINNHLKSDKFANYCFDLGHGAYNGHYKNTLRKISRKKGIYIILTAWYKSPPSYSWICKNGKDMPAKITQRYTSYNDLINELNYPFIRTIL